MKSNPLPSNNFIGNPLKVVSLETSNDHSTLTPYLKAILSGTSRTNSFDEAKSTLPIDPDRAAAIRYIKESAKNRR